jgi:hypothetical protein
MPDIAPLLEIAVVAVAILAIVLALAWYFEVIEVCWWSELRDLERRYRLLQSDNDSLVKEHARVVRENHHLRKLVRIDEVAQRTTREMIQVAYEERRTIEGRALDR